MGKPSKNLKKLIEYIQPHLDIALEGKRNGHNFNSYFPKDLEKILPTCYRDSVYCCIAKLSSHGKTISKWKMDVFNSENILNRNPGVDGTGCLWPLYYAIKCCNHIMLINDPEP